MEPVPHTVVAPTVRKVGEGTKTTGNDGSDVGVSVRVGGEGVGRPGPLLEVGKGLWKKNNRP